MQPLGNPFSYVGAILPDLMRYDISHKTAAERFRPLLHHHHEYIHAVAAGIIIHQEADSYFHHCNTFYTLKADVRTYLARSSSCTATSMLKRVLPHFIVELSFDRFIITEYPHIPDETYSALIQLTNVIPDDIAVRLPWTQHQTQRYLNRFIEYDILKNTRHQEGIIHELKNLFSKLPDVSLSEADIQYVSTIVLHHTDAYMTTYHALLQEIRTACPTYKTLTSPSATTMPPLSRNAAHY